ncbi:MAG: HipA domain-containing protein [Sphaerochaetaceae bacterium]
MKTCLYCGKPVEGQWHVACSKKFFGTNEPPCIDLSQEQLEAIAYKATGKGITIPGVQKKLSLTLQREKGQPPRLTIVDTPTGFILKPQSQEYGQLPEAEDLVMHMATAADIATVPHALITLQNGELAYITRRIDRKGKQRIAMEDFCQLSGRLTEDKYKGSYEQCAKILRQWSSRPLLDITNLYYLLLFCFVTGNSDMHLKNFSLIAEAPGTFILAPAYDLLPVQLLIPKDTEEMALTLCGEKANLSCSTFLQLGNRFGIEERVVLNLIKKLQDLEPTFKVLIETSFVSSELQERMKKLLSDRLLVLAG